MGSKTLKIRNWKGLISLLAITTGYASEMREMREFADASAIEKSAKEAFFGGYEKFAFSREGKTVIAIVGSTTSGLPSSEILVYDKSKDGTFRLMLFRRGIYGIVKAEEQNDNIVFSASTPVLVIPWAGVVADMEQTREPLGKH